MFRLIQQQRVANLLAGRSLNRELTHLLSVTRPPKQTKIPRLTRKKGKSVLFSPKRESLNDFELCKHTAIAFEFIRTTLPTKRI